MIEIWNNWVKNSKEKLEIIEKQEGDIMLSMREREQEKRVARGISKEMGIKRNEKQSLRNKEWHMSTYTE